jgi:hypothetical protein
MCSFLHPSVTSALLAPDVHLNTLFSKTLIIKYYGYICRLWLLHKTPYVSPIMSQISVSSLLCAMLFAIRTVLQITP